MLKYLTLMKVLMSDLSKAVYQFQATSNTDPEKTRFHRPQHLKVVKEAVSAPDAEPAPHVISLQSADCGIGGDQLNYIPKVCFYEKLLLL